jgi:hypothetical protein
MHAPYRRGGSSGAPYAVRERTKLVHVDMEMSSDDILCHAHGWRPR